MKNHHHNYIWIAIIVLSLMGLFVLIKTAYANPLNLPDYALVSSKVEEAYAFAKLNMEKLEGLPCNCRCMTDAEHHGGRTHDRGLADCFMKGDINNGGSWDEHAASCGLCYEDTLIAKQLYEQNKTKEEIKLILEEKYSRQEFGHETVY